MNNKRRLEIQILSTEQASLATQQRFINAWQQGDTASNAGGYE